jgi:hypothetical protein
MAGTGGLHREGDDEWAGSDDDFASVEEDGGCPAVDVRLLIEPLDTAR